MAFKSKMYCCNPFKEEGHARVRKNLRDVQEWMANESPNVLIGGKICSKCRKKLSQKLSEHSEVASAMPGTSKEDVSEDEIAPAIALDYLNSSLQYLGESPVKKKRLQNEKNYPKEKLKKVASVLEHTYVVQPEKEERVEHAESEIIAQLKDKFNSSDSLCDKIQILTVLPKSWSVRKTMREFSASDYMVRRAKQLVAEHGILVTPNPKPGKTLCEKTIQCVRDFYCDHNMSRMMPGKKDYVSVKENGVRLHKQKQLVLHNLKEMYTYFKETYPDLKIGISKFCELRPKHCVLASASGTHTVCVCVSHQNFKLMFEGCKLKELTKHEEHSLPSYKHCLAFVTCNPALPACFFGACPYCPSVAKLNDYLFELFSRNGIDEVSFKCWLTTGRAVLETITKSTDDFLEAFSSSLKQLIPHSFITQQQSQFLKTTKEELKVNEYLVVCDFAENYSFIIQDEVQGFHWNNSQATIHPFVAYYRDVTSNKIQHVSYVEISDCLHHDTVCVYCFQHNFIKFLKCHFPTPKHIYYFSDGCAAQYKNRKNFINVSYHQEDFDVTAEWHFFTTSHGKGPCDGVAGTVKRLATLASLKRPFDNHILTARELFQWSKDNIPSCTFHYTPTSHHDEDMAKLKQRFENTRTIPGTHKIHCIIPIKKGIVKTKAYSTSSESREESVTTMMREMLFTDIHGFVACIYNNHWWVAYVEHTYQDTDEVKTRFLHPHGPSPSFVFPTKPDIHIIKRHTILTRLDPLSQPGRTYSLPGSDLVNINNLIGDL